MSGPVDWNSTPRSSRPAWAVSLSARGDAHKAQAQDHSRALYKVVEWLAIDPAPAGRYGPIGSPRSHLPTSEYPTVSAEVLATREPSTRYIYNSSVITPFAPSPFPSNTVFATGQRDHVNGQHKRWIGADTKLDGRTVWPYNNFCLSRMSGGGGSPSPTPSPEPQTPNNSPGRHPTAPKDFNPSSGPSDSSCPGSLSQRGPSDSLPPHPDFEKCKARAAADPLPLRPASKVMQLRPLRVHFTSAPSFQPTSPAHPDAHWVSTISSTGVQVCPNEHLDEVAWRALGRLESAHRTYFALQNSYNSPGDLPGPSPFRQRANSASSTSSNGSNSGLGTRAAITTHAREFNSLTPFPATKQHRLLRDDDGLVYMLSHWDVAALEQWIVENARACGLKRWLKRQNRRVRRIGSGSSWTYWNFRGRSLSSGSESSISSFGAIGTRPTVPSVCLHGAIGTRPAQSVCSPFGTIGDRRPAQTMVATATRTMTNTAGCDGVAGPSNRRLPARPATAQPAQPAQRPVMRLATTLIGGTAFYTTGVRHNWSGYHSAS